jgi:hypothetical protein
MPGPNFCRLSVFIAVVASAFTSGGSQALQAGSAAGQLTGRWAQQDGSVWDFVAASPGSYTADPVGPNAHCQVADDIEVTGSNGHYKGSMDLYGGCRTVIGTGIITIDIAANGETARVTTTGSACSNCGTGTWKRVNTTVLPSAS